MSVAGLQELLGGDEAEQDADPDAQRAADLSPEGVSPRTLDERVLVGRLLYFSGRVSEADRLLRRVVRERQDRADLLKIWAYIKHARGELTEAIRAFERIQAMLPAEPSALHHLEALHRMAQHVGDSERQELELIGDDAVARAHRAQVELVRAFRLANQQKFTSAIEICDRVADQFRQSDPSLLKLALLEKAAFLEGLSQFDGAIQTLESLGAIRGFEVDQDRLFSLARIYERRSAPEDLQRALKVYRFLHEQTGRAELLSRMSRIVERCGEKAHGEALEKLYLQAFRREQQELTLDEMLTAATLHYVPLSILRSISPPRDELLEGHRRTSGELARLAAVAAAAPSPSRAAPPKTGNGAAAGSHSSADRGDLERGLALLLALLGELEESSEIWRTLLSSEGARPEDAKYFGDIREALEDEAGARALYLAALSHEAVADSTVLGKMLAIEDEVHLRLLSSIFSDEAKRARTYEALKQTAKGHQLAPDAWHTLARFERLIGLAPEAERHRAKAEALLRVRRRSGPKIGQVQVAAVYDFRGKKQGMVHEIWANRYRVRGGAGSGEGGQLDEGSIFGNVARDMMRDIQNVFVAVRAFVEEKFPHLVEDLGEYRYVLKVTKDDEISGGNSAGIAVALAFVSVFLQKPVPQDFAITGSLVADSSAEIRLHRVADVDYKFLGVYQRRLARLIVPNENRVDLETSHVVPRSIWVDRVSFARNLTQVMKLVFGDDLWEW